MIRITFLFLVLVPFSKAAFSQSDTLKIVRIPDLLETPEFTVYQKDTFNRVDTNHLRQGRGIWVLQNRRHVGKSMDYSMTNKGCIVTEHPPYIVFSVRAVYYGQYVDDKKAGIWTQYWPGRQKKLEITFQGDTIAGPIRWYNRQGQLVYRGEVAAGDVMVHFVRLSAAGQVTGALNWFVDDLCDLEW